MVQPDSSVLQVSHEQKGDLLRVTLSGALNESVNLAKEVGAAPKMHLYCGDVQRINSAGVRQWMATFSALRKNGSQLKFFDLPSQLLEQVRFIEGFVEAKEVESVIASAYCQDCDWEASNRFPAQELVTKGVPSPGRCEKCGGEMEFNFAVEAALKWLHER